MAEELWAVEVTPVRGKKRLYVIETDLMGTDKTHRRYRTQKQKSEEYAKMLNEYRIHYKIKSARVVRVRLEVVE